jgi:hypothetical protein
MDQVQAHGRHVTLHAMLISGSVRSLVALFTLTALIFCYTAGAAPAFQFTPAPQETSSSTGGCHGFDPDGSPRGSPRTPCDGPQYLSDAYKLPLMPAAAGGDCGWRMHPPPLLTPVATTRYMPSLARASPPLHLLHCRLLN